MLIGMYDLHHGLLRHWSAPDRARLLADRAAVRVPERIRASDIARVRNEVQHIAREWKAVLTDHEPAEARAIVTKLQGNRVSVAMASPPGFPTPWTISGPLP